MDYNQIQRFLMIVKHSNLSGAAKELYISQPALSLSLANMEKELGMPLFYRVKNRLVLTPEGETLLENFEHVKDAFDQLEEKKKSLQKVEERSIRLGCLGNSLFYATMFMDNFLQADGITIETVCADTETTVEMLKNGQLDFVITSPPLEGRAIGNINLYRENIVLVTSQNHRLSEKSGLMLKDLEHEKLFGLSRQHYFRKLCDRLCREKGYMLDYQMEMNMLDYYSAIKKHQYLDDFIAFCAEDSFESLYGEGYVSHPILDSDFTHMTVLSFMAERKFHFQYEDFVNHLIQQYPQQRKLYEKIYRYIVAGYINESGKEE